jgi:hypothetical protein
VSRADGTGPGVPWTAEADSHFEEMTPYDEHIGWGTCTTAFPEPDPRSYSQPGWG